MNNRTADLMCVRVFDEFLCVACTKQEDGENEESETKTSSISFS